MSGSYTVTPDWTTLPAALLPLAKQHMVVTFPDDDIVITEYLQWAIGYCEQFFGWQIFSAAVAWTPPALGTVARYQCPVQPVSAFTVMSGAVDVSNEYALEQSSPMQSPWLVKKDGEPFPADAAITLTTGYAAAESIPPPARANILRIAGTLYEHRESISAIDLEQMPFWLNDMLGGLWIPRA